MQRGSLTGAEPEAEREAPHGAVALLTNRREQLAGLIGCECVALSGALGVGREGREASNVPVNDVAPLCGIDRRRKHRQQLREGLVAHRTDAAAQVRFLVRPPRRSPGHSAGALSLSRHPRSTAPRHVEEEHGRPREVAVPRRRDRASRQVSVCRSERSAVRRAIQRFEVVIGWRRRRSKRAVRLPTAASWARCSSSMRSSLSRS